MQKKIIIFLFLFILLFTYKLVLAQENSPSPSSSSSNSEAFTNIYLNEIYPSPNSGETEWIEIYNDNDFELDLVNWKIKDAADNKKTFSLIIKAKSFALVEATFLNNSGDMVILLNQNEEEKDKLAENYPSIKNGSSWSKANGIWCIASPTKENINNDCIIPTEKPTTIPSPSTTPSSTIENIFDYEKIEITEIYPNPKDGDEWVEFYNGNDFVVNLEGWYIKDNSGNKKSLEDLEIETKKYGYISFSSGYLNNSGDKITLFNSQNMEKDKLSENYPAIDEAKSWAKVDNNWCVAEGTKGDKNGECQESEEEEKEEDEEEDKKEALLPEDINKIEPEKKLLFIRNLPDFFQSKESSISTKSSILGASNSAVARMGEDIKQISQKDGFVFLITAGLGAIIMLWTGIPLFYPKFRLLFDKINEA